MATDRGLQLLDRFSGEGRTAFTTAQVREALALSPQATSNLLARLIRAGLVDRVSGGRYAIRPLGALGTAAAWDDLGSAVAALFAGRPHRISFLTALDHHGLRKATNDLAQGKQRRPPREWARTFSQRLDTYKRLWASELRDYIPGAIPAFDTVERRIKRQLGPVIAAAKTLTN